MSTSSTAKLPDGNELYFTDSGPVPSSNDYTTLLIFHGSSFHGYGFHKLHSFAAAHNFRTINVNRKDYPGSTKYTDAELEDLKNGRQIFLERLGILVAYLLDYFIREGNIPKVSRDRSAGGIVPVGWSMGTATMMTLFSNPALIPKEVSRDLLDQYVRDIILYDPPHLSFGYEVPKSHITYVPWTDPDCKTGEERYNVFNGWVSSYFDEPDGWAGDISALDMRKRTERSTMDSWTSEEMTAICNPQAAVRSELPMYVEPMQSTIKSMVERVLYNDELVHTYFPRMRVLYLACKRSVWICTWGFHMTKRNYQDRIQNGERIRETKFVPIQNANHFVHYDMPDEFLGIIANALRAAS